MHRSSWWRGLSLASLSLLLALPPFVKTLPVPLCQSVHLLLAVVLHADRGGRCAAAAAVAVSGAGGAPLLCRGGRCAAAEAVAVSGAGLSLASLLLALQLFVKTLPVPLCQSVHLLLAVVLHADHRHNISAADGDPTLS